MKIITTFLHIVFTLITFTALLLSCALFITTREKPMAGIHSFSVLSGSMSPAYKVGTVIFTQPQTAYELGDVIAFKRKGDTITHRIISFKTEKDKRIYVVKGDANNVQDADLVKSDDITGKVFFSIPFFGWIIQQLHTFLGAVLFIGTPALLLILHEIWTIKTEYEVIIEKKVRKKIEKEMQVAMV